MTNRTIGLADAYNATSPTGINLSDAAGNIGNFAGNAAIGETQFTGLFVLAFWMVVLYRSDVSMDVSVVTMTPLVFFLASRGLLPFGQGVMYGLILAVAIVFGFGVFKFIGR